MKEISECEFVSVWGVQVAPSGDLFGYEEVRRCPERHVWTIVESGDDNDGNWYAMPGFRYVNAHGYAVTIKPWDLDTPYAIYFLDDWRDRDALKSLGTSQ